MGYRWLSTSSTDRGPRRRTNEDAVLELPEAGVWVVADGMGGHTRGDLASSAIVEAFDGIGRCRRLGELMAKARLRLHQANERIYHESRRLGAGTIMGSAAVVLLTCRDEYACLWVGDSRLYRLRDGRLEQLTRDHNLAQELVERGEVSPDDAPQHPAARRITRAVGAQPAVRIDETRGRLRDGDVFLLCSDGLPLEVRAEEIAEVLSEDETPAARLVALAVERQARDNVSAAVVRIEETTASAWEDESTTVQNPTLRVTTTGWQTQTTATGL
ncbi:MAG TPA: protein phosphatase 2C domain-containing protein [Pseudomonadales bacterium]